MKKVRSAYVSFLQSLLSPNFMIIYLAVEFRPKGARCRFSGIDSSSPLLRSSWGPAFPSAHLGWERGWLPGSAWAATLGNIRSCYGGGGFLAPLGQPPWGILGVATVGLTAWRHPAATLGTFGVAAMERLLTFGSAAALRIRVSLRWGLLPVCPSPAHPGDFGCRFEVIWLLAVIWQP